MRLAAWATAGLLAASVIVGCGGPTVSPAPAPSASSASVATQTVIATPPGSYAPADLSARPLVWFAPLPPLPGRTGSTDFLEQFTPAAPWTTAAGYIDVYKLYGEWVGDASLDQLRTVVSDIARRGMVLAMEAGALTAPAGCGQGIEGFPGKSAGLDLARRIKAAGGRLAVLALDEPYYYGHVYSGDRACHLDVDAVATEVAEFVSAMRGYFPELQVGDIEPTPDPVSPAGLADWLDAYQRAAGEPFAFLHIDADWGRPSWDGLAHDIQAMSSARGVPFGLIYNGGAAADRAQWTKVAGGRVKRFEASGPPPDHVVFQSWDPQPDKVLPDTDPTTFSGFVVSYFEDHDALGASGSGSRANLALGQHARASRSLPDSPPGAAVDGDFDTLWGSGTDPTQWIEVPLDGPRDVGTIRLTVSQYPAGGTDHFVYGRTRAGHLILLHEFSSTTTDGQVLSFSPPTPWHDLTAIRVETRASPSWVSWREIEVLAP